MKEKILFPKVQKRIADFIYEEEGTIPRSKIITVGTMVLLLSLFYAEILPLFTCVIHLFH